MIFNASNLTEFQLVTVGFLSGLASGFATCFAITRFIVSAAIDKFSLTLVNKYVLRRDCPRADCPLHLPQYNFNEPEDETT